MRPLNQVSINGGEVHVDGQRINNLLGWDVEFTNRNVFKCSLTFYAAVDETRTVHLLERKMEPIEDEV